MDSLTVHQNPMVSADTLTRKEKRIARRKANENKPTTNDHGQKQCRERAERTRQNLMDAIGSGRLTDKNVINALWPKARDCW